MANNIQKKQENMIPIIPGIVENWPITFEMADNENISTGIHPFTCCYFNHAETAVVYNLAEHYHLIKQGQGVPKLAEATAFKTLLMMKHKP